MHRYLTEEADSFTVCLSISVDTSLFACVCVSLSLCLSPSLPVCVSLSAFSFLCFCVCVFLLISLYLSLYLSFSVYLSVCLFVCISLTHVSLFLHSKNDYVAANVVSNVVHYVRHPKWNYFVSNVSHVVVVNRNYMLKCYLK